MPMDRCKCWGTTTVTITIKHCPSASFEISKEIDRVTNFALKDTSLQRLGKATVSLATFTAATADEE